MSKKTKTYRILFDDHRRLNLWSKGCSEGMPQAFPSYWVAVRFPGDLLGLQLGGKTLYQSQ